MRRLRLGLRPVERRDALKLGPCVHRLADLEKAGGGVEVELVGVGEGYFYQLATPCAGTATGKSQESGIVLDVRG